MKKIFVGGVLVLTLSFSSLFNLQTVNAAEKADKGTELIIDKGTFEEIAKKSDVKKLSSKEIPTVKEVDNALKSMKVSKNNPYEKIDLGNGFTVEMGVSTDFGIDKIKTQATQSKTATGYYAIKAAGIKLYDIRVSNNYTYQYGKAIFKWQNPPSASASGFAGWSGEITYKKTVNLDPAAKDSIADSNYSFYKVGGNRHGHMELRFTATGNWYTHNVSIK